MARLWSRKRSDPEPAAAEGEPAETVHLDDDDHAWWAQAEVDRAWTPRDRQRKTSDEHEHDILAEHFGEDWRTNFLPTGPTEEELEEERRREQQALDDQDPYRVLQVSEDASWEEIVTAHRQKARAHHPDQLFGQSDEARAEGEERIRVINQAYSELRVRRGM